MEATTVLGCGSSSGPCSAFGLHLPSLVQRGAPAAVGPAAAAHQPDQQQARSPPTRRPPPASCPSVYRRRTVRCHSCSNRPRPARSSPAPPRRSPRPPRAAASSGVSVPVGFRRASSRHGGDRQRVRRVRGGGRAAQRAVEGGQGRHRAADHGQVELQPAQPLPLARGPGGVALVEPERHPHRRPPRAAPGGRARGGGCG